MFVISCLFRGRSTSYSTKKRGSFLAYRTLAIEIRTGTGRACDLICLKAQPKKNLNCDNWKGHDGHEIKSYRINGELGATVCSNVS